MYNTILLSIFIIQIKIIILPILDTLLYDTMFCFNFEYTNIWVTLKFKNYQGELKIFS